MSLELKELRDRVARRKKWILIGSFVISILVLIIVLSTTVGKITNVFTKAAPNPQPNGIKTMSQKTVAPPLPPFQGPNNATEKTLHSLVATPPLAPASTLPVLKVTEFAACEQAESASLEGNGSKGIDASNPCQTVQNIPVNIVASDYDSNAPTRLTKPVITAEIKPTQSKDIYEYRLSNFKWNDPANWEYADDTAIPSSMVKPDGITLTPANSKQPIRTKSSWAGEKIIVIEWQRSSTSDTNIWLLNSGLIQQFAKNNGWPRLGEIDVFEMFTQDAKDKPRTDFRGNTGTSVASYGQFTMHFGPDKDNPCFCPSSAVKSSWYKRRPMVGSCSAQFPNDEKNSIAVIFGRDGNGQYIQLAQKPQIIKGGQKLGVDSYRVKLNDALVTDKVQNNKNLFWGVPVGDKCAAKGGHDPKTGFPFFESFRLVLEEQEKKDSNAWFKVTNVQVLTKF